MLTTNQPTIVACAKDCYKQFPTIVNVLKESGITYQNTKKDYAAMDNKFSKSRMAIGYSSNLAQLAMTYYWTEMQKESPDKTRLEELYDNFIILSVLAQVVIDGCKREYEIDGNKEIDRISKMSCMTIKEPDGITKIGKVKYRKCDFPEFMKYTRDIKYTKDGKELPQDEIDESKERLKGRINTTLSCPMNWLEYWLDKIQASPTTSTQSISAFFIKMNGKANDRQMSKIRIIIEDYDSFIKQLNIDHSDDNELYEQKLMSKSKDVLSELKKIRIGNIITINRLIETALGLEKQNVNPSCYKTATKYTRKTLNLLYKMNRSKFLSNFICS